MLGPSLFGSGRSWGMLGAGLLAWGGLADPVIATQEAIDQPTDTTEIAELWDKVSPWLELALPWILLAISVFVLYTFIKGRQHRLHNTPRRPQTFTPEMGVLLFFGMYLMGVIAAGAAKKLFGLDQMTAGELMADPSAQVKLQGGFYLGQLLLLVVFLNLRRKPRRMGHDSRTSWFGAMLFGIGTLVLVWPICMSSGNVAAWAIRFVWGVEADPISHDLLNVFISSEKDVWFWSLVGCATLLPGIFEEIMYRGFLQESLSRLGINPWYSIGATSVLFALMHIGSVEPHALVSLFVLSLGFGWAYEKTGRLAAPITMHILFNVGNIALSMWLYGGEAAAS
ncbi:MAG: CPBP family intramembrane metalloprotease [Planctomycetota bacterium]|nr:CPBP family intramembrane metalloprotease [Planctomycetota bacterium]